MNPTLYQNKKSGHSGPEAHKGNRKTNICLVKEMCKDRSVLNSIRRSSSVNRESCKIHFHFNRSRCLSNPNKRKEV